MAMLGNRTSAMYKIRCAECGRLGFHPSRVGAESQAERHQAATEHGVSVDVMEEV